MFLALILLFQSATLSSPVVKADQTKLRIEEFSVNRTCQCVRISVSGLDASDNALETVTYEIPDINNPSATFNGALNALDTVKSGETGGISRKLNFRMLSYLNDNGYLPSVTLVP